MALYAFDGTWNEEEGNPTGDTNVVKFRDAYPQDSQQRNIHYIAGVGTRYGVIGRMFGGVFGAGGKTRAEEMYDKLCEFWEAGDHTIDIIGFSRGAALAVHFANMVEKIGIRQDGDAEGEVLEAKPSIRFLGIWDIVASFGIPRDIVFNFQKTNLGWVLTAPDNVEHCFHAMALNERRNSFRVTRLDKHNQDDRIEELWFRGIHTDIGGGGSGTKLSNITLKWMLEKALDSGIKVRSSAIPSDTSMNRLAQLGHNLDPVVNARRKFWPNDVLHDSAQSIELQVDESQTFIVYAEEHYSWSGIRLVKGAVYSFTVDDKQTWVDKDEDCDADGWTSEKMPWFKGKLIERFEDDRRVPEANWFELIGSLDDDGDSYFRIGRSLPEFQAPEDADLFAFPNDLTTMYHNNKGEITVTVTRLS